MEGLRILQANQPRAHVDSRKWHNPARESSHSSSGSGCSGCRFRNSRLFSFARSFLLLFRRNPKHAGVPPESKPKGANASNEDHGPCHCRQVFQVAQEVSQARISGKREHSPLGKKRNRDCPNAAIGGQNTGANAGRPATAHTDQAAGNRQSVKSLTQEESK